MTTPASSEDAGAKSLNLPLEIISANTVAKRSGSTTIRPDSTNASNSAASSSESCGRPPNQKICPDVASPKLPSKSSRRSQSQPGVNPSTATTPKLVAVSSIRFNITTECWTRRLFNSVRSFGGRATGSCSPALLKRWYIGGRTLLRTVRGFSTAVKMVSGSRLPSANNAAIDGSNEDVKTAFQGKVATVVSDGLLTRRLNLSAIHS